MKYRADIDGLRGIAVLFVVGFHAFPDWIGGGFVGVDVFFVISGFLISGIIFESLDEGGFSFRDFYARRVKRIFPALILVLSACYAFGAVALDPFSFKDLARDVLGAATFVSNFLLWHESGYFARAAETKPLLHLWSLGIEEQFYILWPALAYFTWKRRHNLLTLTVALALLSFLYSTIELDLDPIGSFYSPLSRLWELLLGGMTVLLTRTPKDGAAARWQIGEYAARYRKRILDSKVCEPDALAAVGLLLICTAALSLNKESPFPGWLALYPTIGTSLLLWAGARGAWLSRNVLAQRKLVWVGLISYPLYLWHWPILWATRIYSVGTPDALLRVTAIAISVVLAWLTYSLFERRIRSKPRQSAKTAGLAVSLLIVALLAGHTYSETNNGYAIAYGSHRSNFAELKWIDNDASCIDLLQLHEEAAHGAIFCHLSDATHPPSVAILGDSTAEHLYPGMARLYEPLGQVVINLGMGTCAPFNKLHGSLSWNKPCHLVNRKIYDYVIASHSIKTVVLGIAPWDIRNMQFAGIDQTSSLPDRFKAIAALVNSDLAELHNAGKTVIVTFDAPHIGIDPKSCLKSLIFNYNTECSVTSASVRARMEPYVSYWRKVFAEHPEVCVFNQDELFLSGDGSSYRVMKDGLLLFRDDHHLSFYGSSYVAEAFSHTPCFRKRPVPE